LKKETLESEEFTRLIGPKKAALVKLLYTTKWRVLQKLIPKKAMYTIVRHEGE
jgi:hypothetical protein